MTYRTPAEPEGDPVVLAHRVEIRRSFGSAGPNTLRDHYMKSIALVLVDILGELREMNRRPR